MYRFQGQQSEGINNYICFGTSDSEKCVKDTDKYMYRIIGIEAETGRVKVIKKEALEQTYQWYTDYDTDIDFPNSKIYEALIKFLNDKEYIPEGWENKISVNTWTYGDMWEDSDLGAKQLGAGLYEIETGQKETKWRVKSTEADGGSQYVVQWEDNKVNLPGTTLYYKEESGFWNDRIDSKISLMYLNDYSYSVDDDAKCNYHYEATERSNCKLGWMHLSNNDDSAPDPDEWTMSRVGWWPCDGTFPGFYVNRAGYTYRWHLAANLSIRPVFYIDASQSLKDGTGTVTDPFIIK